MSVQICLCKPTSQSVSLGNVLSKNHFVSFPESYVVFASHTRSGAKNATSILCNDPIRDNRPTYSTIYIIFSILCGVAFSLRILSKVATKSELFMDDYVIGLAYMTGVGLAVVGGQYLTKSGIGKDIVSTMLLNHPEYPGLVLAFVLHRNTGSSH